MDETKGDGSDTQAKQSTWRKNLIVIGSSVLYMIPLFWMWSSADYPDSFGVTITAHGKAGLFENWWYSYVLPQRPDPLDWTLFFYMWAPIVGFLGWAICVTLRERGVKLRIFHDEEAS